MEAFAQRATCSTVKRNRLSIEEIVRRKDGQVDCRWCMRPMRYKRVHGPMAKWSPAPYAWVCEGCGVTVHDGSIVPGEKTWDFRLKENEKKRYSKYLSSILRGKKK